MTAERQAPPPDDRQPHTPYPGLRPFLDYEFMLLHGRDRQIDDVIAQLGRPIEAITPSSGDSASMATPLVAASTMRFVAVLGGSGSGKSSLIRAGVVPKLRKNGLPAVGDLWEAVVSTPGSNFARRDGAAGLETPITRLAREIVAALAPPSGLPSPTAVDERRDHITELLRQPGGLDMVVDLYGPELNLPRSVDAAQACVLVVIDQFEELFHRSTRGQPDVEALIQRVIDHFHQARNGEGSPRCFLAVTMRSEHLQDCAAYIGLPEAINGGAYLISRLDRSDLRAVIERPAQRFLRLRQRRRPIDAPLPDSVAFDPQVIERLIDDALLIKDDPDHLPLLQHALARLWRAAREREQLPADGVPKALTLADLRRMVRPDAARELASGETLELGGNVLEASLQNWADYSYDQHSPAEQKQLSALLRQLAYKDPASGTYTQQRYNVADYADGPAALRRLLDERWIHDVNYLYWDLRNPSVETLKVSHEAFARKWLHFRQLIDDDAMRFERFKELLEWCEDWHAAQGWRNRISRLLESGMLKRMNEARVAEALGPDARGPLDQAGSGVPLPQLWGKWREWIDPKAQGEKPTKPIDQLLTVDLAIMRCYFRLSNRKARASAGLLVIGAALVLVTGPLLLYSGGVQQPFIDNATRFIVAADRNLAFRPKPVLDNLGDNVGVLGDVLKTVTDFGTIEVEVPMSSSLTELLRMASGTVEPGLNANLRAILTRGLWLAAADAVASPDTRAGQRDRRACAKLHGEFVPVPVTAGGPDRPGVLVEDSSSAPALWKASVDAHGQCAVQNPIQSLPPAKQQPLALFDQDFKHLLISSMSDRPGGMPRLSVARVIRSDDGSVVGAEQPFAEVQGEAAETLRGHAAKMTVSTLRTSPASGGLLIHVGGQRWRVVSADRAAVLSPQPAVADLQPLGVGDGACSALHKALVDDRSGYLATSRQTAVYADPQKPYCLFITQVAGSAEGPSSTVLQVYAKPQPADLKDGRLTRKLPHLVSVEMAPSAVGDAHWFVGKGAVLDGWLVYQRKPIDSATAQLYLGLPWSTVALKRLGEDVQAVHCDALPPERRGKQGCATRSGE